MYYDAEQGYGLSFSDKYILYNKNKENIISIANAILETITGFSLISELNTMQAEAHANEVCKEGDTPNHTVFDNKYEIPSYFINLVLKDYNMKVLGW